VKGFPFSNGFHRVSLDPAMTVALRPTTEILADLLRRESEPQQFQGIFAFTQFSIRFQDPSDRRNQVQLVN
jgi:hypothetical protein